MSHEGLPRRCYTKGKHLWMAKCQIKCWWYQLTLSNLRMMRVVTHHLLNLHYRHHLRNFCRFLHWWAPSNQMALMIHGRPSQAQNKNRSWNLYWSHLTSLQTRQCKTSKWKEGLQTLIFWKAYKVRGHSCWNLWIDQSVHLLGAVLAEILEVFQQEA